jgi:DNA invertase Pin-like site-specific DNA recombinase
MLVGYGRTSTADQQAGIQAQERELSAAGCDTLFIEQVSSIGKRQQLEAAFDYVQDGDTLIVTKLDRLARSVPDLLAMVARLEGKNVGLRVLAMSGSQPLDTGTAIGKLMLAVIGAVGQFEREMMLERQREGIAKAKRDGRYTRAVRRPFDGRLLRSLSSASRPQKSPRNWVSGVPASIGCWPNRTATIERLRESKEAAMRTPGTSRPRQ